MGRRKCRAPTARFGPQDGPFAERYATSPTVSEPAVAGASSLYSDRGAPLMKRTILKAATVLFATVGYIAVGIALASAG